jgi:hypothetical protein
MEYEIEAEILSFISVAAGYGTRLMVQSLPAATGQGHLHYVENNRECKDGELY